MKHDNVESMASIFNRIYRARIMPAAVGEFNPLIHPAWLPVFKFAMNSGLTQAEVVEAIQKVSAEKNSRAVDSSQIGLPL